jgi:hydrogenase nickel incorporation protein HypA/HybF
MHELSIALSILDIASEESERLGVVPCAIHVKLGPLAGVVKEALVSAFALSTEGSSWEATELVIDEVPIMGWCDRCEADRPVASIQEFTCQECGQPVERITGGQELELTGLETFE